jgi:regulatory protein
LRSRAELAAALRRRGIAITDVAAILSDLGRIGWIDDARFARAWVRDRLALRPSGHRRLRAELLARGVARADVETALAALLPEGREQALAVEAARGRLRRLRGVPLHVQRRRVGAWLQRRGFGAETIAHVLRSMNANGEEGDLTA